MVTCLIKKESNKYCSIRLSGHSGYAESGSDIICSAISMLTINAANSIMELTDTFIEPVEDDGYLSWNFNDGIDDRAILLMDSLVLGLKMIEDTYSKRYLRLIIEEV